MIIIFKITKFNLFNNHLLEVSHMLRSLVDKDKLFYPSLYLFQYIMIHYDRGLYNL